MSDPIGDGARAAAERLSAQYGPRLTMDVEAALYARGQEQRPEQFIDPISMAGLIVAIASLAWTVYTDLKNKKAQPSKDVVTRTVRIELRNRDDASKATPEITDVVVTEVLKAAGEQA
jgi:hypothetical protein